MGNPDSGLYSPAEKAVLAFANKFSGDHYLIEDADFVPLRRHFTTEVIVELGMLCAQLEGFSRFVVAFGIFDSACPIPERPAEIGGREQVSSG